MLAICEQIGVPFWSPNLPNVVTRIEANSGCDFRHAFWSSGSFRGRLWARFGGHSGVLFGFRGGAYDFSKSSTAPRREHDFEGSGGSKKHPKRYPKQLPAPAWCQEPLGSLWGSLLEQSWVDLGFPKRAERQYMCGAIFRRPKGGTGTPGGGSAQLRPDRWGGVGEG